MKRVLSTVTLLLLLIPVSASATLFKGNLDILQGYLPNIGSFSHFFKVKPNKIKQFKVVTDTDNISSFNDQTGELSLFADIVKGNNVKDTMHITGIMTFDGVTSYDMFVESLTGWFDSEHLNFMPKPANPNISGSVNVNIGQTPNMYLWAGEKSDGDKIQLDIGFDPSKHAVVGEPALIALLGLGLIGMSMTTKRRKT